MDPSMLEQRLGTNERQCVPTFCVSQKRLSLGVDARIKMFPNSARFSTKKVFLEKAHKTKCPKFTLSFSFRARSAGRETKAKKYFF
mmetsp:Transcript_40400/g.48433  ORF Transcript_40400/g.48433 Transcript_40400/m.48433 type:complete len:86 (+) Transcript_40400:1310-1567(+)